MRRSAFLLAILVLAAACVEDRRPEGCDDVEVTVEVAVAADGMSPNNPGVCRGQSVTIAIDAEVDAIFHIHGYEEAVPALEIATGERAEIQFVANRSGQFPVEVHPLDDPQGVNVGIFTVYEP
jgi:hypothetical protein